MTRMPNIRLYIQMDKCSCGIKSKGGTWGLKI